MLHLEKYVSGSMIDALTMVSMWPAAKLVGFGIYTMEALSRQCHSVHLLRASGCTSELLATLLLLLLLLMLKWVL